MIDLKEIVFGVFVVAGVCALVAAGHAFSLAMDKMIIAPRRLSRDFSKRFRALLEFAAPRLFAWRRIRDEHFRPYLDRYRVWGFLPAEHFERGAPPSLLTSDPRYSRTRGTSLYLHEIHRRDSDPCLHNHPWKWMLSIVLVGSYTECYLNAHGDPEWRTIKAWRPRIIRHGDFHTIAEVHGRSCWTLFLCGPRVSSWGFLAPRGFVEWRERLAERGINPYAPTAAEVPNGS